MRDSLGCWWMRALGGEGAPAHHKRSDRCHRARRLGLTVWRRPIGLLDGRRRIGSILRKGEAEHRASSNYSRRVSGETLGAGDDGGRS